MKEQLPNDSAWMVDIGGQQSRAFCIADGFQANTVEESLHVPVPRDWSSDFFSSEAKISYLRGVYCTRQVHFCTSVRGAGIY